MNFFTAQLLLRLEALMAATGLTVPEIVGSMVPMAHTTLLILPCATDEDEEGAIHEALKASQGNKVGLQSLGYTLERIKAFVSGGCERHLWKISVVNMSKGVKHKWCDFSHPWRHKFNFILRRGRIGLSPEEGVNKGKIRWPSSWSPSINSDTLIAWGVHPLQKELLLWDIYNYASLSDPGITNWILGAGGRILRIDWNNPFMPKLKGLEYATGQCIQLCMRKPVFYPECPCCQDCYASSWEGMTVPQECHRCYVCMNNLLRPRITVAGLHDLVTETPKASRSLECSGNVHVGMKLPLFSCWPHNASYEARVLEDQQRKYWESHPNKRRPQ
uniref:Uncharacterized protein n=1 Tax=Eutreptiella gymnastica TaxID=73025 RepID=A0A7S1J2D2_9EUGL|mmetsp:Transcript_61867/g.110191  ORF Transcript_61867/g.110191 Transcript_61867/m.110191 type:complete len:331 (+) Transcript_61867:114-1106(+)